MNAETMERGEGIIGLAMLILLALALAAGQASDRDGAGTDRVSTLSRPAVARLVEESAQAGVAASRPGLRRFAVMPLPAGFGVDLYQSGRPGRSTAGGGVREL